MSYGDGDCICEPAVGKGAYRTEPEIRAECPEHGVAFDCALCGDQLAVGVFYGKYRCDGCGAWTVKPDPSEPRPLPWPDEREERGEFEAEKLERAGELADFDADNKSGGLRREQGRL